MEQPIFSLNYTSCRADQIVQVVQLWRSRANRPELVEVVISVDGINAAAVASAKAVVNAKVVIQNQPPFNCFGAETQFVSSTGCRAFKDCADGEIVDVLTHTGSWKHAVVRHYGRQDLSMVSISRSGNTVGLRATKNHRWFLRGGEITDNLKEGDLLRGSVPIFHGWSFESAPFLEKLYWAYGYVYGDGAVSTDKRGNSYSHVRLCGSDSKFQHRFVELGFGTSQPLSCKGDFFAYTGTYLKTLPNPCSDSPEMIRAFVAGYLDADGTKNSNHSPGTNNSRFMRIQATGEASVNFIRKCFPVAGVFIVSQKELTGETTNFGVRPYTVLFQITTSIDNKFNSPPKVVRIEKAGVDDVWCLEVDDDKSFVLPCGLVTGNCVRGWNAGAATTTGKVIINVADDFMPPQNWDVALTNLQPPGWMNSEYVVHVASGYVEDIMVLSIATRKRYEKFGYMLYPGYESMFSDTEFTTVAYRDGVVINAKHLLFEHLHCDCGKRPKDQHDVVHGSQERWTRGEMLFNYRKGIDFPIDEGPKANLHNVDVLKKDDRPYAVYIQTTDDSFCLPEVCGRLLEEGASDFFVCIPDEYWSGSPTPQANIDRIRSVMAGITKAGGNVRIRVFDVSNYRFAGDSRISVETRVRNDTLCWIRREGFQNILIVDDDELWTKGLLDKIKDAVVTSAPACISAPMIPVVGVPGYPIHQASDRAVVYIDGTHTFRECRSPAVDHYLLANGIVIHFTACRKNLQEVIDKHRASGHYDDPEYDFEGWIKNVLPNLKPGWKGAHMYRRYQIWPVVRNWTKSEFEQIPESLRPYMGAPVDAVSPIAPMLERAKRSQQAQAAPKLHPFRLTQVEQFQGFSNNPFRQP